MDGKDCIVLYRNGTVTGVRGIPRRTSDLVRLAMDELLKLLEDGHARTTLQLAMELKTSSEDIRRKLEYMEMIGVIRRISMTASSCSGCSGCNGEGHGAGKSGCSGCMPGSDLLNMGDMWEVVKK